jgi:hypothetical protein
LYGVPIYSYSPTLTNGKDILENILSLEKDFMKFVDLKSQVANLSTGTYFVAE